MTIVLALVFWFVLLILMRKVSRQEDRIKKQAATIEIMKLRLNKIAYGQKETTEKGQTGQTRRSTSNNTG